MTTQEWATIASPIATLVAGVIAYLVYRNQKNGEVQSAARMIWLDVSRAEEVMTRLKENGDKIEEFTESILPNNGWRQMMQFISSKMQGDDVRCITDFFKHCEHIEKAMRGTEQLLFEHYRQRVKAVEAIYAEEMMQDKELQDKPKLRENIVKYGASKHNFDATDIKRIFLKHLSCIRFISNTPCGERLKKLGDMR